MLSMKCTCIVYTMYTYHAFAKASQTFRNHGITTSFHRKGVRLPPYQLFFEGLTYQLGTDAEQSSSGAACIMPDIQSNDPVSVPSNSFKPCPLLFSLLLSVDPLAPCINNGKELYCRAITLCGQHLQNGCSTCSSS